MPCPCGSNIKYKKCCGKRQSNISQPDFVSDPIKSPASTTEFYREQEGAKQQTQNPTNHQLPKHKSAQEYYELGVSFVNKGLLHEAIESFQGALAIQPAAEVYFNLAVIQERVGNLQESVDSCLNALSLKPGLAVIHCQLGSLFQKMGNFGDAISSYKEALVIQPDQVEVHNSIGAVQRETGLFVEAETSFLKALSIRPDYEMASLNLASLYLQQEKTEDAIDCCRKSLVINPDSALLYFCLAEIYEQKGDLEKAFLNLNRAYDLDHNVNECLILKARLFIKEGKMDLASKQLAEIKINESDSGYFRWQKYYLQGKSYLGQEFMEEALCSFKEALTTDIEKAKTYYMLAEIEFRLGHFEETLDGFQKAISVDPENAAFYVGLGSTYRELGRVDDAIFYCNKALKIDSEHEAAHFSLAKFYEQEGLMDEAFAHLAKALELGYSPEECSLVKAKMLYREGNTEEAIKNLNSNDSQRCDNAYYAIEKSFLLGKYYDRLGLVDEAFTCFQEGNNLQMESYEAKKINESEFIEIIGKNKELFTENMVSKFTPYVSEEVERPVFFVGFPRSGTTLVDQMLDAHPLVDVIEEKPLIAELIELVELNIGPYPEVVPRLNDEQIKHLRSYYADAAKKHLPGCLGGHLVVDKLPLNIVHLGFIQKVFYGSKIIVALRHPLDVCLSNFMQFYRLNTSMKHFLTLEGAAKLYTEIMQLWIHYQKTFELDLHVVKYEDLISDTENEAKKLIDFLKLEWDENVLNYYKHAQKRSSIMTPSYQDVMKPIFKRAKFRWKKYQKYLRPAIPSLEPYIKAFGYEIDLHDS